MNAEQTSYRAHIPKLCEAAGCSHFDITRLQWARYKRAGYDRIFQGFEIDDGSDEGFWIQPDDWNYCIMESTGLEDQRGQSLYEYDLIRTPGQYGYDYGMMIRQGPFWAIRIYGLTLANDETTSLLPLGMTPMNLTRIGSAFDAPETLGQLYGGLSAQSLHERANRDIRDREPSLGSAPGGPDYEALFGGTEG